jgi:trans-aconitate methyltransferase
MIFTTHPLSEIIPALEEALSLHPTVSFTVLDPDLFCGSYAGTTVTWEGTTYLYRSLQSWMELAQLLTCRMRVPHKPDKAHLTLTFELLQADSFHTTKIPKEEKYGSHSPFFQIHKMEEPAFYHYFHEALLHARVADRNSVLDLGIHRGDEFDVIRKILDIEQYQSMHFVGIDHAKSALEEARERFPETNVTFHAHDINQLETLDLGTFDLLISIGTLQSPGIHFKPLLMNLVQHYLSRDSALILGFPNSRWRDGEMLYGAKAAHYNFSEMGVVLEDILFAKRYLQQKKYRVMITGKHYLFLTAVRIGQKA